ncbi:MAG: hypothetical protein IT385_17150 [Deltaproteobacteria bacterium]|nr:hypothetical protein [Deltaproteobacteria bacterium]
MRRSLVPSLVVLGLVTLSACGTAPVATRFAVDAPSGAIVHPVQQALVTEGFDIAEVDERIGVVRSDWTTVPQENMSSATHRRYTVVVKEQPAGAEVTVRGEFKHCSQTAPAGTVTTTTECARTGYRTGVCQTTEQRAEIVCKPITAILPDDQQDLDAFGASLRAQLGAAPGPVGAR